MSLPCENVPKRDGVGAHAKGAPLPRNSLGKANDSRFSGGVVGLADIAVKSGSTGDVDDTAVLRRVAGFGLDTRERRGCADETEGCADVDLHNDVPCIVRHRMEHAVISEPSCQ